MARNNKSRQRTSIPFKPAGDVRPERKRSGSVVVSRGGTGGSRRIFADFLRSRPAVIALFCAFLSIFVPSCSTTVPLPRYSPPPQRTIPAPPAARPYLPDGWADITAKAKQPQIKLWLVNRDFSGTMVLRELQQDPATRQLLSSEEINMVATMSLRSKVPDNHPDYRVTRVPAVIDMKRNFSSYAYTEKGLLRRVVVFRKQETIMELELMQEQSAAEFDALTNDLVTFATTLYER